MVIGTITDYPPDCRDCNARNACRACKRKCLITHTSSKPAALSFFKVMSSMFSTSLEIPSQCAEKIRSSGGCRHAILESPNGGLWDILLCCVGSSAFLKDGWEHFFSYHSIQPQDILVFRHVRDAHFLVQIFENSGKEKQRDLGCPFTPAAGMPKNNSPLKPETKFVQVEKDDFRPGMSFKKDELHFSRVINKTAISGRSAEFYVPTWFGRRWLPRGKAKVVLLCERRKWCVNFKAVSGCPKLNSKSWKDFAIQNQLKLNDTLHFQLIDRSNYVFRVRISRA